MPTPESTSSARQPAAPPTRRRHDDRPAIDIADEPQFEYLFEVSPPFESVILDVILTVVSDLGQRKFW